MIFQRSVVLLSDSPCKSLKNRFSLENQESRRGSLSASGSINRLIYDVLKENKKVVMIPFNLRLETVRLLFYTYTKQEIMLQYYRSFLAGRPIGLVGL